MAEENNRSYDACMSRSIRINGLTIYDRIPFLSIKKTAYYRVKLDITTTNNNVAKKTFVDFEIAGGRLTSVRAYSDAYVGSYKILLQPIDNTDNIEVAIGDIKFIYDFANGAEEQITGINHDIPVTSVNVISADLIVEYSFNAFEVLNKTNSNENKISEDTEKVLYFGTLYYLDTNVSAKSMTVDEWKIGTLTVQDINVLDHLTLSNWKFDIDTSDNNIHTLTVEVVPSR